MRSLTPESESNSQNSTPHQSLIRATDLDKEEDELLDFKENLEEMSENSNFIYQGQKEENNKNKEQNQNQFSSNSSK